MLIFNAMTVTVFENIWSQAAKNVILILKKAPGGMFHN